MFSNNSVVYRNINKISDAIDDVLGNNKFLAENIEKAKKAGLRIKESDLIIKEHTFLKDLCSTLKYPFVDMPFDIINSISKSLQKNKHEKIASLGNSIKNFGLFKKGIQRAEGKKSYELVEKALEQFGAKDGDKAERYISDFIESRAHKITSIAKNYSSRDERTINRIVTGSIGALFSSVDMFNISMLEKDNIDSANKAQKSRFQQEMARIGISAGLTFITLGALDRYIKGKDFLTAIVIAGSTLTAEIISRLVKHKPLVPLTPKQAAKIAKKHSDKTQTPKDLSNIATQKMYKNSANGLYNTVMQKKNPPESQIQRETKKRNGILPKIAIASALVSAFYLGSKALKGDYTKMLKKKEFLERERLKVASYLDGSLKEAMDKKTVKSVNEINNFKGKINISDFFENIVEKFTKRSVKIDVDDIEREINAIINTDEGKNLDAVLNVYKKQIAVLRENGSAKFEAKMNRDIPAALYEGFSKIIKTVYDFLSLPGELIDKIIEGRFKKSEKLFKEFSDKLTKENPEMSVKNYQKELSEFANILRRNEGREYNYEKTIEHIIRHIKNFEQPSETGNLAHMTRTLVTLISSWFYVNDFRNSVLIESGGENTQRAKEVMNDSIGYKASNFFFNGTLMNLANSIFKDTLNNSLLAASIIPMGTEFLNEFLIRKTIARPMHKLNSRDEIIEYERSRADKKGPLGTWTRFYKKITGQKSLSEKYNASKTNKN